MKVRKASKKDWPEIRRMTAGLHGFEMKFDPRFHVDDKTGDVIGGMLEKVLRKKPGIMLVAVEGDELIGYACGWIEKKSPHTSTQTRTGYFCDLYVKEGHRGKGTGKTLAEGVMSFFRQKGIRFVNIEVFVKNNVARDLYESLGFEKLTFNMLIDLKKK